MNKQYTDDDRFHRPMMLRESCHSHAWPAALGFPQRSSGAT